MLFVGIDPGLNNTGVGIIRVDRKKISYVDHYLIKSNKSMSTLEKLSHIYRSLFNYLYNYPTRFTAIEDIFYAKNIKSAILLGQVRGVLIGCLTQLNITIYEYTALQIKKAVVGYGRAEKEQVKRLVLMHLNLKDDFIKMQDDCSDALACALCLAYNIERENVLQNKGDIIR